MVAAQETAVLSPVSEGTQVSRIAESLDVPEFVPPDRSNPKRMPALVVEAQVHGQMANGRNLQIIRAEPSTLPDLGSIKSEIAAREAEQKAEAARQAVQPKEYPLDAEHIITMGVTVFANGVSHVTFSDGAGNTIAAVCGFDVSLLSGISGFQMGGTDVSLNFTPGFHIAARDGSPAASGFPSLDVAPGAIVFPGGKADAKILSDLEILRDLIGNEKPRLIAFQQKLRIREAKQQTWYAKNLVPPKDETIWLRPHGGSRYLAQDAAKSHAAGGVK